MAALRAMSCGPQALFAREGSPGGVKNHTLFLFGFILKKLCGRRNAGNR